jgi:hypothetical protein
MLPLTAAYGKSKGYFGVFEMKTRIIEKGFLGEALKNPRDDPSFY